MNEPSNEKFFGGQVPPWYFWALLLAFCVSIVFSAPLWVVGPLGGLALGTYFVWSNKVGRGADRVIHYPESVRNNAGWSRR